MKRVLLSAFVRSGMHRLVHGMTRRRLTIFMLHRFEDPATGVRGIAPAALRRTLAVLRSEGFTFVDLHQGLRQLRDEPDGVHRAVAFTLDDGYADQVRVGAPLFAEFDCPATVFTTTGFLDGRIWFWWDQLEYIIRKTAEPGLSVSIGDLEATFELRSERARDAALADLTAACKRVADRVKHDAIAHLAHDAQVALPPTAPPRYAPVTWDELRAAERQGMRFGPHTVTHPILSRTDDHQSEAEVRDSWHRLQQEARNPAPVFCYPNGQHGDFGPREMATLGKLGLLAAVTGLPGYAAHTHIAAGAEGQRFQIPRFGLSGDPVLAVQFASGLEALKDKVRGRLWR